MKTTHPHRLVRNLLLAMLATLPAVANVIPVDLPHPDDKPPSKDKPVKVFILSGQSNALGFGRIEGSTPLYSRVFLSADPSAKACKLPVENAALLPLKVHKDGSETVSIEVPYDGNYHLHAGTGDGQRTVTLEGKTVYSKTPGAAPVLTKVKLEKGKRYPVTVTGAQPGPEGLWMEMVDLEGKGDLRWVVEKLGRFPYMLDDKGQWTARNDVMLNDAYMGKGSSAPHGAKACGPTFGPELGFGYVLGTYLDEPVIVMKADIGNRSLGWDILPPGSKSYTFEGNNYPGYGETLDADGSVRKPKPGEWYAGKQYDDYTAAIHNVLDNFGERYPEYAAQGFEVAGFFWWQGHKDGPNPAHNARYEENLVNLIKAWRAEFKAPKATWAIATVGFHGKDMPEHYVKIAQAQLNVADPKLHPEFAGTVKTIDTRPFWRGPEVSPKNQDYHYNHNAETYMLCGDALGRATVEMLGGKVEYPAAKLDKEIQAVPDMKLATDEELLAMTSALRPIMLDRLIPDYVGTAEGVPSYRRNGMALEAILANALPEKAKVTESLSSQLDNMIQYYNLAGIDSYNWKSFGPDMQKAEWQYLTFDPKEPIAKNAKGELGDMYRQVTLPAGMENWFAPDFDLSKTGWKTGAAPFGQKLGKLEPLITSCKVPYCGCNIPPATLWDKEVLLMRQAFDVPAFKEGHRYRIVVGGAGHPWSGEGFALYLNGKQIAEAKGGYYKSGGDARGAFVFNDIMPEFKNGKATFAVKAFLRQTGFRGKSAPPSGHMSVWIQEAKLPPAVEPLMTKATK